MRKLCTACLPVSGIFDGLIATELSASLGTLDAKSGVFHTGVTKEFMDHCVSWLENSECRDLSEEVNFVKYTWPCPPPGSSSAASSSSSSYPNTRTSGSGSGSVSYMSGTPEIIGTCYEKSQTVNCEVRTIVEDVVVNCQGRQQDIWLRASKVGPTPDNWSMLQASAPATVTVAKRRTASYNNKCLFVMTTSSTASCKELAAAYTTPKLYEFEIFVLRPPDSGPTDDGMYNAESLLLKSMDFIGRDSPYVLSSKGPSKASLSSSSSSSP